MFVLFVEFLSISVLETDVCLFESEFNITFHLTRSFRNFNQRKFSRLSMKPLSGVFISEFQS